MLLLSCDTSDVEAQMTGSLTDAGAVGCSGTPADDTASALRQKASGTT
jgi:hypothetical protein